MQHSHEHNASLSKDFLLQHISPRSFFFFQRKGKLLYQTNLSHHPGKSDALDLTESPPTQETESPNSTSGEVSLVHGLQDENQRLSKENEELRANLIHKLVHQTFNLAQVELDNTGKARGCQARGGKVQRKGGVQVKEGRVRTEGRVQIQGGGHIHHKLTQHTPQHTHTLNNKPGHLTHQTYTPRI